jgi:hypothetical protein
MSFCWLSHLQSTGVRYELSGVVACTTSGLRLEPTGSSLWSWFGLEHLYEAWVLPKLLFAVQGIGSNFPHSVPFTSS